MYPDSLKNLVENFKKLPGVGDKTAERYAFYMMNLNDDEIKDFSDSLTYLKQNIKTCHICGILSDDDICPICQDNARNKDVLIVVQDSKEAFLLEKMGNFDGYYHVLGGLISPLDDIGPNDINIKSLIDRVRSNSIKEVVLAIKSGIEADTTSLYIKRLLENENVVVSRIANGIPVGADMEYIDALTLDSALKNRKEVLD